MSDRSALGRSRLNTPKAAAIAGIAFSVLLIAILWLLRRSVPADPLDSGAWLATERGSVVFALNLVPFAGVAFLWFIGVLRDRLGAQEDRFFATVFFGSGLLFLAMLFAAAAIGGAVMLLASSSEQNELSSSAMFRYARASVFILTNVYAVKMAVVFMISTSTVVIYTALDRHPGLLPRRHPAGRELHLRMECRGAACLGLSGQHSHPDIKPRRRTCRCPLTAMRSTPIVDR